MAVRPRNPHTIMANISQFDLNLALQQWLARLGQSPHMRAENLSELESHVRDSVVTLQSKGLTPDEAFLIGTRRAGNPADLEAEFAKENDGQGWRDNLKRNLHLHPSRIIHVLVLLYFSLSCWLLWGVLRVSEMLTAISLKLHSSGPPAFTRLLQGLMPYWYVPPALAAVYCGYAWTRKLDGRDSWFGYFAVATGCLLLLAFPTLIAAGLPVIDILNHLPSAWK